MRSGDPILCFGNQCFSDIRWQRGSVDGDSAVDDGGGVATHVDSTAVRAADAGASAAPEQDASTSTPEPTRANRRRIENVPVEIGRRVSRCLPIMAVHRPRRVVAKASASELFYTRSDVELDALRSHGEHVTERGDIVSVPYRTALSRAA